MTLKEFLIERKQTLLALERRATRQAKTALTAQLQVIDVIFVFLSTKQSEDDMMKLRLTLDKQASSVEDIKPRQENAELTDALMELAKELEPGKKFALNNLPDGTKPRSVSAKVYALRANGKLPKSIYPATRTEKLNGKSQTVVYLVRKKED